MDRRTLLQTSGVGALAGVTSLAGVTALAAAPVHASPPVRHPGSSWRMARELIADGPDPDRAEGLNLFGQFVGSWDVTVTEHFGDPAPDPYPAEWHFGWILHGRGVQDVFGRVPPSTDNGTTIRIYDPEADRWVVSWFGPFDPEDMTIRHFQAEQVGDEIVQTGAEFEGSPMRWIFSDIEERRFHWRNEILFDGQPDWIVVIEMGATRRWPPRG